MRSTIGTFAVSLVSRLLVCVLLFCILLGIHQFGYERVVAPPQARPAPRLPAIPGISGAAIHGMLTGQQTASAATVSLTGENTSDWIHWGLGDSGGVDRKSGVTPQISSYSVLGSGSIHQFSAYPTSYTWTDGDVPASVTASTQSGVYSNPGSGNGFQFTVPADTMQRILRVYVSVANGRGMLMAHLSDASAPLYDDISTSSSAGIDDFVYTLSYNALTAGQSLVVSFTSLDNSATVSLEAATLQAGPGSLLIMPLGDSITYGTASSDGGGYRTYLWHALAASGYNVRFVGSHPAGPLSIDQDNEGHPGYRIDQIQPSVVSWLTTYHPQIVLLHIGTNDILQNYDLGNLTTRLGTLIDTILATEPKATLLVAQIIPIGNPTLNPYVLAYNSAIAGLVQARVAQGQHISVVDMYDAVPTTDLTDNVHPNDVGYALMSQVWYKALLPLLSH